MAKTATHKAKAVSVHVGLNAVDPKHYGGWSGDLVACEFDAQDMAAIARAAGMKSTLLLTKKATRAKVLAAVRSASRMLRSVICFLLRTWRSDSRCDRRRGGQTRRNLVPV
jgi:hypothetical protein